MSEGTTLSERGRDVEKASGGRMGVTSASPRWMRRVLLAAGAYNLVWGALVVLFPLELFRRLGMEPPNYPQIWQCVGMIVGVYGVGYAVAAFDPVRHWPIVLVGLLGKLLGPVGFVRAAWAGELPWLFGLVNVTNDLIWLVPFTLILVHAYRAETAARRGAPSD